MCRRALTATRIASVRCEPSTLMQIGQQAVRWRGRRWRPSHRSRRGENPKVVESPKDDCQCPKFKSTGKNSSTKDEG